MSNINFEVYDLTTKRVLVTIEGRGEAEKKFVELQKKYPKQKLWLRMAKNQL